MKKANYIKTAIFTFIFAFTLLFSNISFANSMPIDSSIKETIAEEVNVDSEQDVLPEAEKFPVGKTCMNSVVLDYIMDEYIHLTGLSEEVVRLLFDEIKNNGFTNKQRDSILKKLGQKNISASDEDIIIDIQSRYAQISKNISENELRALQQYLLYYSLKYYEPMTADIAQFQSYIKSAPSTVEIPPAVTAPTANPAPNTISYQDVGIPSINDSKSITKASSDYIGDLKLFSGASTSSSSSISGHAWLQVYNSSSNVISIANGTIGPQKASQYGTWQRSEHTGLYYNMEGYQRSIDPTGMSGYVCIQVNLTDYWRGVLSEFIRNSDAWSYTNNCSSFASKAWNEVCATKVYAGLIPTPAYLRDDIKRIGNYATDLPFYRYYYTYYAQGVNGRPVLSMYN